MRHYNLADIVPHLLPPGSPVTIAQVLELSFWNSSWSNAVFIVDVYDMIPRFALSAMLLILAIVQTLKQSLTMYKATERWQPNRYMERLVKDGILYFLVYVSAFPALPSPSVTATFSIPSFSSIHRQTNTLVYPLPNRKERTL